MAPCNFSYQHSAPYLGSRPQVHHVIHGLALLTELQVGPVASLVPPLIVEHIGFIETLQEAFLIEDALLYDKLGVKSKQVVCEET